LKTPQQPRGIARRALAKVLHAVGSALKFLFILGLVVIPVPITLRPKGEKAGRRNLPTDVLRNRGG